MNVPGATTNFVTLLSYELRSHSVAAAENGTSAASQSHANPNIREWTKQIARGDEAAFTGFHEQYSLRIYKYLLVLARGNELDAREVLQTVMLKAAKSFKVFDEEPKLWAWLGRLARNAYVDLRRTRNRQGKFVSLDHPDSAVSQPEASENRMVSAMAQVVENLTPDERELIRSAYVDECPLQALADETGQTYKALESRLGRLRLKIKTQLLNQLRHE